MSPWADTADLAAVALELERSGEFLRHDAAASVAVLGAHGHWGAAAEIESSVDRVTTWIAEWQTSLRSRIAILEAADALPLGGPVRWAPSPVDGRALAALGLLGGAGGRALTSAGLLPAPAPSGDVESGRLLATELDAALDSGQPTRVLDVLRALEAVADQPATAVGFIDGLGLDMLRVFPAMLTNHLGVSHADLHRHLLPIGRALATASRASDPPLSFGGAALMADDAGASLGPAVYFDFGAFDPGFLVDAAVAFLPTFDELHLIMAAPHYVLPAGGFAGDDPRGALLRAMTADPELTVDLIARLDAAGALGSLIRPATPFRGEEARLVGGLLAELATVGGVSGPAPAAAHAMRLVIETADAALVDPAVALGLAHMVAPHVGALAEPELVVDLPASTLRGELEDLGGEQRRIAVAGLMDTIVRHDEARRVISLAVATLTAATLHDTFDPDDSVPMHHVADDLAAAWALVNDAARRIDLDEARRADAATELIGLTAGVVVAGAAAVATAVMPMGIPAGIAIGVAPSVAVTLAAPDADAVEATLIDGVRNLHDIKEFSTFVLAAILHERDLIRLPERLLHGHRMVAPRSASDWDDLTATVAAARIDTQQWFSAVAAIAGYAITADEG